MSLEGKSPAEIQALAQLADNVLSNPKSRPVFNRMLKDNNPGLSIPEIEIEDRVAAAVKPHIDEVEQMKAKNAQSDAEKQANLLYETLRDDGVIKNRNQFTELVKYASEKGFQTSESGLRMAASHRAAEQESAEPTPQSASFGTFDFSKGEAHKDLMSNPNEWARNAAVQAIDEFRKKKSA